MLTCPCAWASSIQCFDLPEPSGLTPVDVRPHTRMWLGASSSSRSVVLCLGCQRAPVSVSRCSQLRPVVGRDRAEGTRHSLRAIHDISGGGDAHVTSASPFVVDNAVWHSLFYAVPNPISRRQHVRCAAEHHLQFRPRNCSALTTSYMNCVRGRVWFIIVCICLSMVVVCCGPQSRRDHVRRTAASRSRR